VDVVLSPLVLLCAVLFKNIRQRGLSRLPISRNIIMKVGVFPIVNHYYEPFFQVDSLKNELCNDRDLKAIDWNSKEQLEFLSSFEYGNELKTFPEHKKDEKTYYYRNNTFAVGDVITLYNIVRKKKPSKIIEIGSGNSTLMAMHAIQKNTKENEQYTCEHICIEPYEHAWLNQLDIKLIREKVEDVSKNEFKSLKNGDILFIDSSHVIKPQGDVLFEYLELLPLLQKGVLIHIHDIFSPKDYPDDWIKTRMRLWNEQYLVEAFLSYNKEFKILHAAHYLRYTFKRQYLSMCPELSKILTLTDPCSLWLEKI
jgi:hypothetical protein